MNLTQLNVFREVMTTGSVSQAARNLARTQPAISLALKNLEDSLGLTLFERQGRQLIPVPEAHYLLTEASEILDRVSTVSHTMKSLVSTQTGTLNIAAMPGPSAYLFPRFISRALTKTQDVRVSLSSRSSQQIQELARTQSIDFGFADLATPSTKPPQFSQEVISAQCFCAVPSDHPLSTRTQIAITDLDGVPMGALQSSHALYERTMTAFADTGASFNACVDSQIFLPLLQFISAGQCCAIVDPLTVASEQQTNSTQGRVTFRPLGDTLRYDYVILTPHQRPLSQLAQKVRSGWRDHVLNLLKEIDAQPIHHAQKADLRHDG